MSQWPPDACACSATLDAIEGQVISGAARRFMKVLRQSVANLPMYFLPPAAI